MEYRLTKNIESPDRWVIAKKGETVIELSRDENGILVFDGTSSYYVDENEIERVK
jgi:hypothetical protein